MTAYNNYKQSEAVCHNRPIIPKRLDPSKNGALAVQRTLNVTDDADKEQQKAQAQTGLIQPHHAVLK